MVDVPIAVGFNIDNNVLIVTGALIVSAITLGTKIIMDRVANKINKENTAHIEAQNKQLSEMKVDLAKVISKQESNESLLSTTLNSLNTHSSNIANSITGLIGDYKEHKGKAETAIDQQEKRIDDNVDLFKTFIASVPFKLNSEEKE